MSASQQRFLAIGDIHGCAHTLEALLARLDLSRYERIFFLGDYIDRGRHTPMTLQTLIQLQQRWPQVTCLLGNHEYALRHYLQHHELLIPDTRDTLGAFRNQIPGDVQQFIQSLLSYYETEEFIFVHAGLLNKPLSEHTAIELVDFGGVDPSYNHGKTVVHGHIRVESPTMTSHAININTGAGSRVGGALTAIELPSKKVIAEPVDDRDRAPSRMVPFGFPGRTT